ncbi:MAG TPA: IF2 family translation initiation factor [Mycobacterium sp.]|nr:IF2 family translation initiation factor [Mycobacterium sp.]
MSIATIPRSILRFQYQLVRIPLQLIEDRVVARMGSEAPARLVYERALGVLDATIGSALGDPRLNRRGASLAKRSDELARAARLDAAASQRVKQANAVLENSRDEVVADLMQARADKEQAAEDARTSAQERKQAATETAQKRAAAAKEQADDLAARRKETAEAAKRRDQERIQKAEVKVMNAGRFDLH